MFRLLVAVYAWQVDLSSLLEHGGQLTSFFYSISSFLSFEMGFLTYLLVAGCGFVGVLHFLWPKDASYTS